MICGYKLSAEMLGGLIQPAHHLSRMVEAEVLCLLHRIPHRDEEPSVQSPCQGLCSSSSALSFGPAQAAPVTLPYPCLSILADPKPVAYSSLRSSSTCDSSVIGCASYVLQLSAAHHSSGDLRPSAQGTGVPKSGNWPILTLVDRAMQQVKFPKSSKRLLPSLQYKVVLCPWALWVVAGSMSSGRPIKLFCPVGSQPSQVV